MELPDVTTLAPDMMDTTENNYLYQLHQQQQPPYYELYTTAQFVTGLMLYPVICLFGLTGNSLILLVLANKSVLSSTDVLLAALAISDAVKLLSDLLYSATCFTLQVNAIAGQSMYAYVYPYAHFVFNAAVCVSAWLVVSLAVERYFLVCWPTRTRSLTSVSKSRAVAVIVVLVMMTIAVTGHALRYRTVRVRDSSGSWRIDVELTELWRVDAFVKSYNWTQNLLRSIVPVVILVVTGVAIVTALRRRPSLRIDDRKVAVRRRIAIMLVVVVVVFVVCIIPDAVMSVLYLGYTESDSYLVKAIREVTDTMLAVNAASNFVIYFVFNRGFRDRLGEHLCCRRESVPRNAGGSTTFSRVVRRSDVSSTCCHRRRSPGTFELELTTLRRTATTSSGVGGKRSRRRRYTEAQTDM